MKKFYVLLILSSISMLAACGSSSAPPTGNSAKANTTANPGNPGSVDNTMVSGPAGPDMTNVNLGENPIPPGFDPTGGNRNVNTAKMVVQKKAGMPAADNSEIFTEFTDVPRETRIFKDHAQLSKIIKTGIPPKQTVKVYLKNGKVMDLAAEKIPNLSTEPALSITNMLGITPPPTEQEKRDAAKKRAQAEP